MSTLYFCRYFLSRGFVNFVKNGSFASLCHPWTCRSVTFVFCDFQMKICSYIYNYSRGNQETECHQLQVVQTYWAFICASCAGTLQTDNQKGSIRSFHLQHKIQIIIFKFYVWYFSILSNFYYWSIIWNITEILTVMFFFFWQAFPSKTEKFKQ